MRFNKCFIVMLALVFVCSIASASVGVKEEGVMLGAATDINFVGVGITASGAYGGKTVTLAGTAEESSTYKTLTVAESGTTFVATGTTAIGAYSRRFRLPDITSANDGVFYTFITGVSLGVSVPDLIIDPGETDSIIFGEGVTDKMAISGAYADSYPTITLKAFGGNWYVESIRPNIQGGGAWTNLGNDA